MQSVSPARTQQLATTAMGRHVHQTHNVSQPHVSILYARSVVVRHSKMVDYYVMGIYVLMTQIAHLTIVMITIVRAVIH